MVTVQEIFNRMDDTRKKQRDIRTVYKDALNTSLEYKEILKKIKEELEKKKQIELATKQQFIAEFVKLGDYAIDLASDQELLTDAAMTMLMKGETVEVVDENDVTYQPVFNVKFKKT